MCSGRLEDAALDPASKLTGGKSDQMCLVRSDRPVLTCRNVHQPADAVSKGLDLSTDLPFDVFVEVSESEGVPVSITETVGSGVPTVATAVGVLRNSSVMTTAFYFLPIRPRPTLPVRCRDSGVELDACAAKAAKEHWPGSASRSATTPSEPPLVTSLPLARARLQADECESGLDRRDGRTELRPCVGLVLAVCRVGS